VVIWGDRRAGFVSFTPDQIIDAGTLDRDGRRLTEMDDIWVKLASAAMGLDNCRRWRLRIAPMFDEIRSDPVVEEALAVVRNAA